MYIGYNMVTIDIRILFNLIYYIYASFVSALSRSLDSRDKSAVRYPNENGIIRMEIVNRIILLVLS